MPQHILLRAVEKLDLIQVKGLIDELENKVSDLEVFESIFQEYLLHENTLM